MYLLILLLTLSRPPSTVGATRDTAERQLWRSCMGRSGVRQLNDACRAACDLDGDGDVDGDDVGMWQRRWYVPASQPTTQPTTQPALRPTDCGCTCVCPCVSATTRPDGADITWQVWRRLPQDLQREFDGFITGFGAKLATRPE